MQHNNIENQKPLTILAAGSLRGVLADLCRACISRQERKFNLLLGSSVSYEKELNRERSVISLFQPIAPTPSSC